MHPPLLTELQKEAKELRNEVVENTAGIKSEGGPLVAQVDRLMAQLFGEA